MSNNIPDFQTIMLPLLELLSDDHEHPMNSVLENLTNRFGLTDEDLRQMVPSGQQPLFKNRVTWAISYLKNAGLLYYSKRGVYRITESGKKVLMEKINSLSISYLKKFDDFKKWQSSTNETDANQITDNTISSDKTPDEIIGDTVKSVNNKVALDLLEILKSKPPNYFELFVLELLSKMGYGGTEDINFEVVGQSGDNGIDGIIYQDQLGIDRVYVQAKKWADNKVQSKDIRDFIGALSLKGTNKGIFITTSRFTDDAQKTVTMNPQNRIILIDGQQLAEFAIKYNVGVQVRSTYVVKGLDNDFFDEV